MVQKTWLAVTNTPASILRRTLVMKIMTCSILVVMISTLGCGQEQAEDFPKGKMEHHFAIKELDSFHDVLHPLVHDALPEKDYEAIRSQLDKLLEYATAIDEASLPEEYAPKNKEFKNLSKLLVSQINELQQLGEKSNEETFEAKFEEMHETFETLAHMLM
jgi:hypothetical protein